MGRGGTNAKFLWERQIGAVRAGLIPSSAMRVRDQTGEKKEQNRSLLYSSTNGTEDDREVEHFRLLPLVGDFKFESRTLIREKALDVLESSRVLGSKSAALEERKDVIEVLLARELLDIGHQLVLWDTEERVLDPGGAGTRVS